MNITNNWIFILQTGKPYIFTIPSDNKCVSTSVIVLTWTYPHNWSPAPHLIQTSTQLPP